MCLNNHIVLVNSMKNNLIYLLNKIFVELIDLNVLLMCVILFFFEFFVPVTLVEQQHVLVVVDTQRKIIHYLDNIKRGKDYKEAAMLHKFVVGCFSDLLDAFEYSYAEEVLIYNLNIVKLPWTVNESNDCGVYVAFLWSNLWAIITLALFMLPRID